MFQTLGPATVKTLLRPATVESLTVTCTSRLLEPAERSVRRPGWSATRMRGPLLLCSKNCGWLYACHISQHERKISQVSNFKFHVCLTSCLTISSTDDLIKFIAFCVYSIFSKVIRRLSMFHTLGPATVKTLLRPAVETSWRNSLMMQNQVRGIFTLKRNIRVKWYRLWKMFASIYCYFE